jgi:hypothetical protein
LYWPLVGQDICSLSAMADCTTYIQYSHTMSQ